MKRALFFSILVLISNTLMAQVDYYDITTHENVNVNKNINQNIHVGGAIYENKTVTTIDYGALAEANANMQRLQFERQKYADDQQRQKALEMAANPLKAFDYGTLFTETMSAKYLKGYGFKSYLIRWCKPHSDLFYWSKWGQMENKSTDGITTEITIYLPINDIEGKLQNVKAYADMSHIQEGAVNDSCGINGEAIYVYKKSTTRTTVFRTSGFRGTLIWEDEYIYCITDNYIAYDPYLGSGVRYFVKVRTYGNKEETSFEKLEGRRYYLKNLVEKVIATADIENEKFVKPKKK